MLVVSSLVDLHLKRSLYRELEKSNRQSGCIKYKYRYTKNRRTNAIYTIWHQLWCPYYFFLVEDSFMYFIGTLFVSLLSLPFYAVHTLSTLGQRNYHYISTMSDYKKAFHGSRPSIMMFSAPWCHACKHMEPGFNSVAGLHNHAIDFYIVNTDKIKPLIDQCNIRGLPTIICSKNGKEYQRERGGMSKSEFTQCVHTFLASLAAEQSKPKKASKKPVADKKPQVKKKSKAKKVVTHSQPEIKKVVVKKELHRKPKKAQKHSKTAKKNVHTKKRKKALSTRS